MMYYNNLFKLYLVFFVMGGIMRRSVFDREFGYTKKRLNRIISHDLDICFGDRDRLVYSLCRAVALEKVRDFDSRVSEVFDLPLGFCYVSSKLFKDMSYYREKDSKYAYFYSPKIDRSDPSVDV